ncbi:pheromone receptor transcription factor [Ziziphus jujuba]|uniref:Pheromone receptor transcription factor n=2 Tax=Ziziphus jujuba TaxID=326968 RepID=A0A6P3Z8T1_ZIZJJ|nr:pheromone receptor transcription factor [Ziziphus jujuba]KAH7533537.1 hypothetical protein FEM48_Zijuj04G0141400 [Ziziphus jujuba var. spinosa]
MGLGKRKIISMEKIENEQYRLVRFSKRRNGLFKKAQKLSSLTGCRIAVLVISEAGVPYTHGSPSFDDVVRDSLISTNSDSEQSSSGSDNNNDDADHSSLMNVDNIDDCKSIEEMIELKSQLEERLEMVNCRVRATEFEFVRGLFA